MPSILDEAHTVESVASDHLGLRLSSAKSRTFCDGCSTTGRIKDCWLTSIWSRHSGRSMTVRMRRRFCSVNWMPGPRRSRRPFQRTRAAARDHPEPVERAAASIWHVPFDDMRKRSTTSHDGKICCPPAAASRRWRNCSNSGGASRSPTSVYWIERSLTRHGLPRTTLAAGADERRGNPPPKELFQARSECDPDERDAGDGPFRRLRLLPVSRGARRRCPTLQVGSPFDYPRQVAIDLSCAICPIRGVKPEFERWTGTHDPAYVERTMGTPLPCLPAMTLLRRTAPAWQIGLASRDLAAVQPGRWDPSPSIVGAIQGQSARCAARDRQFLAGRRRPGRYPAERDHHAAALQRSRSTAAPGPTRGDSCCGRKSRYGLPVAGSDHQACGRGSAG